MPQIDYNNVGAGKTHDAAVCAYDDAHGTYADGVEKMAEDERLPIGQMPKAPDPSPFTLGPLAPGGR
jgi:hypothetical protein